MDREKIEYVVDALSRYWKKNKNLLFTLPVVNCEISKCIEIPPRFQLVDLPEWAKELGDNGRILVPVVCIKKGENIVWERTDWWAVVFWYLNGLAERTYENQFGAIHSYRFKLKAWDNRMWDRAWVNHIALFLRKWAVKLTQKNENDLFAQLPSAKIILTHDVDAITKTFTIRTKQAAFHSFNALRGLANGHLRFAVDKMNKALQFAFRSDDYWCFDKIKELEKKYNVRSHFNFYAGKDNRDLNLKRMLIDPEYDVMQERIKKEIKNLLSYGWEIGLHLSFKSWDSAEKIANEKKYLEKVTGKEIHSCRQHWLMFSWRKTWQSQEQAGLKLDTTLGFNDRPGFRNGSALCISPWSFEKNESMELEIIPMVLMDSHLYDYKNLDYNGRLTELTKWINEIKLVRGTASVIWHQRVMSRDYGWNEGYDMLLSLL